MNQNNFEILRNQLISEIYNLNNKSITEDFKCKFLNVTEYCTLSLMNEEENFFAYFLIQMKREIDFELPTAAGTRYTGKDYIIYFNPFIFLHCSLLEMKALLKHEIYHIINLHHSRIRALAKCYSNLAVNIAMDISINQFIANMPLWADTLEDVKRSYNVDLAENQSLEQYASILQKAFDKLKDGNEDYKSKNIKDAGERESNKKHNVEAAHDIWSFDANMDILAEKEIIKRLACNASKGKVPDSVEEILKDLNKSPEISWKYYLKRYLGTLPSGYKKTITRRNRRQPDRMELRGRLSKHAAQLVVAIDISGSISDKEIEQIMTEIFAIVKNCPFEITVLECDSEIRRVYHLKSTKDIKKKVNTKGSTRFSPVFEYMEKKRMKNHILIYFTDGIGEKHLSTVPVHRKTIWVLTGKGEELSLIEPLGIVKKLSNIKIQEPDLDYAKNAIKEYRMLEWAK